MRPKLLHIYGNTFDRNWVGVRLTHRIGNPAADNWFSYNHFRGNNLKPPFSGQSPSPGGESFAGIWAYKIPSVYLYGFSGVVSNRFSELKNGIISERSTFYIYSATFESMIDDGIVEGYDTGIGILALDDSFVYQTGLGKQASFTFVSCQNAGIYSKSSTIYSSHSNFGRLGAYGVKVEEPYDHYAQITNNRFEHTDPAVFLVNAIHVKRSATGNDKINDTYILNNHSNAAALILFNDQTGGTGYAEVLRDTIISQNTIHTSGMEIRAGTGHFAGMV